MQYPSRPHSHILEQKSETFLRNNLPQDWTVTRLSIDYGQDLNIEISEYGQMKGLELIVQLKSCSVSNSSKDCERIQLKVSTYNYL